MVVVLKNYNRRFIQDHTNSSVNISTTNNSVSINGLSTIGNDDYNVITCPHCGAYTLADREECLECGAIIEDEDELSYYNETA